MATAHKTTRNPGKWVTYRLIPGGGRVDSLPDAKRQAQQQANVEGQDVQVAKYFMNHLGNSYKPSVVVFTAKSKKSKRNIDPLSVMALMQGTGADRVLLGKRGFRELSHTPGSRNGRNPEDIEFLNDRAPCPSVGHIEFTPDGIERFYRDGYVYQAFSSTPVFEDGYRMGAVEAAVDVRESVNPKTGKKHFVIVNKSTGQEEGYFWNKSAAGNALTSLAKRTYEVKAVTAPPPRDENPANKEFYLRETTPSGTPEHLRSFRLYTRSGKYGKFGQIDNVGANGLAWTRASYLKKGYVEVPVPAVNPKRNPAAESDAVYEEFHGVPPENTLAIREDVHYHSHLAGLGDLVLVRIKLAGGRGVGQLITINAPDPDKAPVEDVVRTACNEAKNQMYLVGGDQAINVEDLGFRDSFDINHDGETFEATELKDLMVLGEIHKLTYRTQKAFDKFVTTDYFHKLGEDTKVRPFLLYDTMNKRMQIAGGEYVIRDVGIVN